MPTKKEIRRAQAKRARESLSDSYIIRLLIDEFNDIIQPNKTELKPSDIRKYPELIECKRIQIKINRLIRDYKNEKY